MVDKEFIDQLRRCDFFAGTRDDFYRTAGKSSVLVHGQHKDPAPLVSILLTTYKRPHWLKIALESALNQEGFDDYEIIIVDNEGESLDVETETSELVRSYDDAKIVYYRNVPSAYYKMDTAVSLSRSKWFCIVHDDDFLSKDHLKFMIGVLREHSDIGYISCTRQTFDTTNEAASCVQSRESVGSTYSLEHYPGKSACADCWPGWLGALIHRENYINMGGMSLPVNTGIGDYIMVMKYMDRYDSVYAASTKAPLYFYRISTNQLSATGSATWFKNYISAYMLFKYMAKRYHVVFRSFWYYIASIIIHAKIKDINQTKTWIGDGALDIEEFGRLTGMPERNSRGRRWRMGKKLLRRLRKHYVKTVFSSNETT